MEKREEIKDSVRQRLIEFMAEQITKEESFADLKSELIQEFLIDKKIKNVVVEKTIDNLSDMKIRSNVFSGNEPTNTLFDKMAKSKEEADKFISNKMDKQGDLIKKIFDIKTGHEPVNLKKFMDTELEKDSTTFKRLIDLIEGGDLKQSYKPEMFTDYTLRYNYEGMTEEQKTMMRKTNLYLLKKSLENPRNNEFYTFEVKSFEEDKNVRKEYLVENKIDKFRFVCSYVYNAFKNEKYIDTLYVDAGGLLIQNEDLGIPFAIEAIDIMDAAEGIKREIAEVTKEKLSKLLRPES